MWASTVENRVSTEFRRSFELIASKVQFWTLMPVQSLPGVIKVSRVAFGDFGDGMAEATLESTAAIDESHEGRHVGPAPVAANNLGWSQGNGSDSIYLRLVKWFDNQTKWD